MENHTDLRVATIFSCSSVFFAFFRHDKITSSSEKINEKKRIYLYFVFTLLISRARKIPFSTYFLSAFSRSLVPLSLSLSLSRLPVVCAAYFRPSYSKRKKTFVAVLLQSQLIQWTSAELTSQ